MKCYTHRDRDAIGVCSICGKGLCEMCAGHIEGRLYCKKDFDDVYGIPPPPVDKWIEMNIGLKNDNKFLNNMLIDYVKPIVEESRMKLSSWHYLWEEKPWPKPMGKGLTLRLRFFAEEGTISDLKKKLDNIFLKLETTFPTSYYGHCFGNHGECEEEYTDEVDEWGNEGWELGKEMLKFSSESALKLIEAEIRTMDDKTYSKDILYYADRYVHMFLNTVNTIMPFQESEFLMHEGIQRESNNTIGRQLSKDELRNIKDLISQEISSITK